MNNATYSGRLVGGVAVVVVMPVVISGTVIRTADRRSIIHSMLPLSLNELSAECL